MKKNEYQTASLRIAQCQALCDELLALNRGDKQAKEKAAQRGAAIMAEIERQMNG